MREMLDGIPCINKGLYCAELGSIAQEGTVHELRAAPMKTLKHGFLKKRQTRRSATLDLLKLQMIRYLAHHAANLMNQAARAWQVCTTSLTSNATLVASPS
jgi:hypothetical protein